MLIGITGTNGSGKGAVVEYLKSKNFKHYSVRQRLTELLKERSLPIDRPHLGQLGDELRKQHGAGYFSDYFSEKMHQEEVPNAVVESIRSVGEAKSLKEKGGVMLALDADQNLRYQRIFGRGSTTDRVDFDTFVAQEENEWTAKTDEGMNVPEVMKMADYTILNDGTLEELHQKIEEFLDKFNTVQT